MEYYLIGAVVVVAAVLAWRFPGTWKVIAGAALAISAALLAGAVRRRTDTEPAPEPAPEPADVAHTEIDLALDRRLEQIEGNTARERAEERARRIADEGRIE